MKSEISLPDRILRSLFVAWAVGLGWAIRGDFGHMLGAMFPGAALGLAFCYVSGQKNLFRWAPILATGTGFAIGQGGYMSYGILHRYAQADTFVNYSYGFLTLFLQGGCWGVFGCAFAGLLLENKPLKFREWLTALAVIFAVGLTFQTDVVSGLGFHVNPPRSNASIGFLGGAIGLFGWLVYARKPYGFKGALLGFIGFGLGMACGRLFCNIANVIEEPLGFSINSWNVMEMSVGLIGGFIFTFGMLGKRAPKHMAAPPSPLLSIPGALYVVTLILVLHRFLRTETEKRLPEWTESFTKYGYPNPDVLAHKTLWMLNLLCIAGFVLTLIWLILLYRNKTKYAWFPVLALCGEMLLFQNIAALYFYYPRVPNQINMHTMFWVLFGLMTLYVLFRSFVKPHPETSDADEIAENIHWKSWIAGAAGIFLLLIGITHFVNGEETMKGANTRFPIWSWSQGPFPGTQPPTPPPSTK